MVVIIIKPKQVLKDIAKANPNIWRLVKFARENKGKGNIPDWPDFLYLPMSAGMALGKVNEGLETTLNPTSPALIIAAASWRVSQGVYRFDPDLYKELCGQPLDGNLPYDVLKRMPEWCVYIEMQDNVFDGFWAHLIDDINRTGYEDLELRIVVLPKIGEPMTAIIKLGDWTLAEGIDKVRREAMERVPAGVELPEYGKEGTKLIAGMVQLLLYLCAENADMPQVPHPSTRARASGKIDAPREPRIWTVGERIGHNLRKYRNDEALKEQKEQQEQKIAGTHASLRPHVRRAHWHHYWTGPRKGKRKVILRWLPPVPVNITDDEGPAVIYKIKENKNE